jgi:hypothetical protein
LLTVIAQLPVAITLELVKAYAFDQAFELTPISALAS